MQATEIDFEILLEIGAAGLEWSTKLHPRNSLFLERGLCNQTLGFELLRCENSHSRGSRQELKSWREREQPEDRKGRDSLERETLLNEKG